MKYYLRFITAGIICGVFCMASYAIDNEYFLCSDIISLFGMQEVSYFAQYMSEIIYWFMPLLFFQIFFGTYIYRHFCTASIYFFSRYEKRNRWFTKEIFTLYMFTCIYLLLMLAAGIIVCNVFSVVKFDLYAVKTLFYYIIIYSLYLFVTALAINLVAIIYNSNVAFVVVEGINIFCIVMFTVTGDFFAPDGIVLEQYEWMLKVNPVYYLVFGMINSESEYLHAASVFMVMAVILVGVGLIVINRHNFIEANKETGGM